MSVSKIIDKYSIFFMTFQTCQSLVTYNIIWKKNTLKSILIEMLLKNDTKQDYGFKKIRASKKRKIFIY